MEHSTESGLPSGGGDIPSGNLGMPGSRYAGVLQEEVQLLGFTRSSCLGAAGMCHRRVLLAGGCSGLCRTAPAAEIASTGAGLANWGLISLILLFSFASCPLYLPVEHSSFPCVASALLMQKVTDLPAL